MSGKSKKKVRPGKAAVREGFDQAEGDILATRNTPAAGSSCQFRRWRIWICLMLAMVTTAVYLPVRHYQFVNYDDDVYVTLNPHIHHGLTRKAVEWSFAAGLLYSSPNADYWRPLSYLSHALDIELFGFQPAGHHLMSVALHVAATVSLFWVLQLMTGALWRSAFVAALFALHPLHVESAAWVAERKDVLSGLFFILTLGAYTRYSRKPSVSGYLLVLGLFVLGLMSKPIVVTLPLVLLLLDYWPLRRCAGPAKAEDYYRSDLRSQFPIQTVLRLVLEKLPFFVLAAGLSLFTFHSQKAVGAVSHLDQVSLSARIENALVSYGAYLLNLFWPADLAVLYPYHLVLPAWQVWGSLVLLGGITVLVLAGARRCPWLPVGWCWYLGMLLPVIGIIQVGSQARADRYTYLSSIGLFLMVVWTVGELCPSWRHRKGLLGVLMGLVVAIMTVCTSVQISYWRNSESLWMHALACTSDNAIAHDNFGSALFQKGRVDEAIAQYQTALQIEPYNAAAHNNLGNALLKKGRVDEAIAHYQTTLQIKPDNAEAWYNLGNALLKKGRVDEAIAPYQAALQIKPDNAEAWYNLGNALIQKGGVDEAIVYFQKALEIKPEYAEAHNNLGSALLQKGDANEAIAHFQIALEIKPDYVEAHIGLGNALFQKGNGDEAIAHFQKALAIKPDNAEACTSLGNALLQKGNVDEAIARFQKALAIKPDDAEARTGLGNALYQKGKMDEAITQYQKALRIKPDNEEAHNNLGSVLLQEGRVDEAIVHYQQALQINTNNAEAHYNLANVLYQRGRVDEAIVHFQKALQIKPDFADAHNNLGSVLLQRGRVDEAIVHFQKALQIKPHDVITRNNLDKALLQKGSADETIAH
jgi:tetratricopeptide (TPR) repeat protein